MTRCRLHDTRAHYRLAVDATVDDDVVVDDNVSAIVMAFDDNSRRVDRRRDSSLSPTLYYRRVRDGQDSDNSECLCMYTNILL